MAAVPVPATLALCLLCLALGQAAAGEGRPSRAPRRSSARRGTFAAAEPSGSAQPPRPTLAQALRRLKPVPRLLSSDSGSSYGSEPASTQPQEQLGGSGDGGTGFRPQDEGPAIPGRKDYPWERIRTFSLAPSRLPSPPATVLRIGTALTLDPFKTAGEKGITFLYAYHLYLEVLALEMWYPTLQGAPFSVELLVVDDMDDEEQAGMAYEHLYNHGIRLFLGPYGDRRSLQAARVVTEKGGLLVCPGSADPMVFAGHDRVFGTSAPQGELMTTALDALKARGAKTVVVVFEDMPGARGVCGPVQRHAEARGFKFLSSRVLSYQNSGDVVAGYRALQPDVVVACIDTVCERFLQELHNSNVNPKAIVMGGRCWEQKDSIFVDSDDTMWLGHWLLSARARYAIPPVVLGTAPMSLAEFHDGYHAITGNSYQQDGYSAPVLPAFGAIATLMLAVQKANSVDPDEVAGAMRNLTEVSFNADGMSIVTPKVLQTFDGDEVIVAPPEAAAQQLFYPRASYTDWPCYDSWDDIHFGMLLKGNGSNGTSCQKCPKRTMSFFDFTLGYRVCVECPPGMIEVKDEFDFGVCVNCSAGRVNDRQKGTCELCPEGKFQNESSQTTCYSCPAGSFQGRPGETVCNPCENFARPHAYYNREPASTNCHRCPTGALCERDSNGLHSTITNGDEFYLLESDDAHREPELHWCPHGDGRACVSHGRCYELSYGETAMEGLMCGKCRPGFAKTASPLSLCQPCEGLSNAVGGMLWHLFFMCTLMGVMELLILTTDFSRPGQLHSVVVKQFFNYIQMALVVTNRISFSSFPDWGLGQFMNSLSNSIGLSAFRVSYSMFSLSCFTWEMFPSWEYYQVVQVAGLLWIPASMGALWGIFEFYRACAKKSKKPSRERLVTLFTVFLFFMLSPVTEMNLTSWLCYHYDVPRSLHDPSLKCFSRELLPWQVAGAVGVVIFSLGIPTALYLLLVYFKQKKGLRDPSVMRMLGFLTSGFESDFWYFECIYMLRKVLFTAVLQLPGFSAAEEESTYTIQNTLLVFISGTFLVIQLYFQPYDNRGYFVLDQIETASLTAIMVTPLLQVWINALSLAYVSTHNTWVIWLQEGICMVVITVLHCRVLLFVLWGVARGALRVYMRERKNTHIGRLLGFFVPKGRAVVTPAGMELHDVHGVSWKLLMDMFLNLFRLHAGRKSCVTYEGLAASIQRVMVESAHLREEESLRLQAPVRFFIRGLKQRVERLPILRGFFRDMISKLEDFLREKGFKVSGKRNLKRLQKKKEPKSPTSGGGDAADDGDDGESSAPMSSEPSIACGRVGFTEENVIMTYGEVFSIEELHIAFTLLQEEAYQEHSPVLPAIEEEEEMGYSASYMRSTTRRSGAVGSPAGLRSGGLSVLHHSVHHGDGSHGLGQDMESPFGSEMLGCENLSPEQIADSAVRAERQEKLICLSELKRVQEELACCRRQLEGRASTASPQQQPAETKPSSQPQLQPVVPEPQQQRNSLSPTLGPKGMPPSPHLRATSPATTGPSPFASEGIASVAQEFALQVDEASAAMAASSVPRPEEPVNRAHPSIASAAGRARASKVAPAMRPSGARSTRLAEAVDVALTEESEELAEPTLSSTEASDSGRQPTAAAAAASSAAAASNPGPAARESTRESSARGSARHSGRDSSRPRDAAEWNELLRKPIREDDEVGLGAIHVSFMQQEVHSLTRQRDEALLAREALELQLDRMRCELRKAQLDAVESVKRREDAEERLTVLEATNNSWKRWAKHMQGSPEEGKEATVEEFHGGLLHTLQDAEGIEDPSRRKHTPAGQQAFLGSCSPSAMRSPGAKAKASPRQPTLQQPTPRQGPEQLN